MDGTESKVFSVWGREAPRCCTTVGFGSGPGHARKRFVHLKVGNEEFKHHAPGEFTQEEREERIADHTAASREPRGLVAFGHSPVLAGQPLVEPPGHVVDEHGNQQRADVIREQEYSRADVDTEDEEVLQPIAGSGHVEDRWSVR